MKTTQRSVLKVAILSALGALSTNALAVADLTGLAVLGTSSVPVKVGKELPSTGTLTANSVGQLAAYIAIPAGYAVDTTNKYLNIKINLLNGAKFGATAPTLNCNTALAKATVPAGTGLVSTVSIGGTPGVSNVTFVVGAVGVSASAAPVAEASGAFCYMSAASIGYTGTSDKTISATIEYKDGATNVVSGANGTYISFVKGLSASFSAGSNVVIDVAASSNKFSGGGVTGYAGLAQFGGVSTTIFTADLTSPMTATAIIPAAGASTQFSVTVGGSPLAGASNVYLSTVADGCSNATYSATISTSASTTVTISGVSAPDVSGGLGVCLVYSGTTPIAEGAITATISRSMENAGFQPDFSPVAAPLASFKKNGASTYVDFLTNPAGFPTYVRFTNPTSLTGNVLVDAINDDGGKGATPWTFKLSAGSSVMYPVADIVKNTAVPAAAATSGNKYRLVINAEFPTISVQAVNISKDGNSFGQLTGIRGGATQ